jgi:outer membrane protein TolC
MLLDQIRPALAAQRRPLPNLRAQINHARAEFLPEVDRVNLQILNFDEH